MVSGPLHNFEMPSLKWGSRKVMRCMKVDDMSAPARCHRKSVGRRVSFKFSAEQKLGFGGEIENYPAAAEQRRRPVDENETTKPWNLRTRRARLEPEVNEIVNSNSISISKVRGSVGGSPVEVKMKSAWCLRGGGEKRERAKFSVSLSKEEIEMDFMAITGHRAPRRPKKRPKIVQKQLDMLFPGLWLTEVNADLYKVADVGETGKVIN